MNDELPIDFSQPRRQSKIGIVLLAAMEIGQIWKQLLPIVAIALFKKKDNLLYIFLGFLIIVLVFTIRAILHYKNFSFWVAHLTKDFYIQKGIVHKKTIIIKKENIQEVNIHQPFLHKILGIYQLEIDSPGKEGNEAKVQAISWQDAVMLKAYLLDKPMDSSTQVEKIKPTSAPQDSFVISPWTLLKYGLTANYLRNFLAIFVFGGYLINKFSEYKEILDVDSYLKMGEKQVSAMEINLQMILLLFIVLVFVFTLGLVFNIVKSFILFFNFKLERKEQYLNIQHGLFSTKTYLLAKSKIQMLTEVQNYIQKKWNISHFEIQQIEKETDRKTNKIQIPIDDDQKRQWLMQFVFSAKPEFAFNSRALKRKLWLQHFKFIVIPIIMFIFASSFWELNILGLLAYCLLVELYIIIRYNNNRLMLNEKWMATQSGFWDIKTKTIDLDKIQTMAVKQYFWQKKSKIASIKVYTAGGNLYFSSVQASTVQKMINYCLYKIENTENLNNEDERLASSC
ncbi:MAG: PH domain-containing protein [Bacteroidetes bacterium]|nr:PH domain-containing protein [Bacteroidota bacterium]